MVPTPVQAEAISAIVLDERDALVQAYTGSGKTLSFLIPLFTVLEQSMRGMDKKKRRLAGVQAVVVAPTRELAMQLAKVARPARCHHVGSHAQQHLALGHVP